jgi:hypothetical protein
MALILKTADGLALNARAVQGVTTPTFGQYRHALTGLGAGQAGKSKIAPCLNNELSKP